VVSVKLGAVIREATPLLLLMFIVGVPVYVRPEPSTLNELTPEPVMVIAPVPNANTRVPALEVKFPVESIKFDNVKVLPVNAKDFAVATVNALPKVTLNALVIALLIVTPLVVIVLFAAMVIVEVFDHVVFVDRVMLPETVIPASPEMLQVAPVVVTLKQGLLLLIVIVGEPELASIITASVEVGTDAPPAPPELADQLVVLKASQVPLPPRQYLSAI